MKIAYVINSVEGGGAALPVPDIVTTLQRHGASVRVLALTRRDGRALPAMHGAGLDVTVRAGGESDHWSAARWLQRQIADHRPDLIWTSLTRATLLGQLIGLRNRLPVASWQHAAFLKPANKILLNRLQSLSSLWIGDSEMVTRLTGERLGIPPGRLTTWPIFAADPHAPQALPWQPGQDIRIGSLGRLHPVKGYDVLLSALEILRTTGFRAPAPFKIMVGGDGPDRQSLELARDRAGLSTVDFRGYVAQPSAFLATLHLYLQPSRSEGFCIAAHEAMQAGLPVIASAVGELANSVDDGVTGKIVPPGDPVALADALAMLLSHPERLSAMGMTARQRTLDRFSRDRFDAAGHSILERLGGIVQARRRANG